LDIDIAGGLRRTYQAGIDTCDSRGRLAVVLQNEEDGERLAKRHVRRIWPSVSKMTDLIPVGARGRETSEPCALYSDLGFRTLSGGIGGDLGSGPHLFAGFVEGPCEASYSSCGECSY